MYGHYGEFIKCEDGMVIMQTRDLKTTVTMAALRVPKRQVYKMSGTKVIEKIMRIYSHLPTI